MDDYLKYMARSGANLLNYPNTFQVDHIMSLVSHLQCIRCGTEYPADTVMNLCPLDNSPVEIIMDLERLAAEQPDLCLVSTPNATICGVSVACCRWISTTPMTSHIYSAWARATHRCWTTTIIRWHKRTGFTLYVKDEGKAHPGFGANPTQSFKDRGMAMTISMAHKAGIRKLAVPTQGNAGDSLCEYANAAGMEAVVAMPDNTPMPILGRVAALASQSERFKLELVKGTIREAGALAEGKMAG